MRFWLLALAAAGVLLLGVACGSGDGAADAGGGVGADIGADTSTIVDTLTDTGALDTTGHDQVDAVDLADGGEARDVAPTDVLPEDTPSPIDSHAADILPDERQPDVFRCETAEDCAWLLEDLDGAARACGTADCIPSLGECVLGQETDGAPCVSGDPCTVDEVCYAGVCGTGAPRDCDDGDVCTEDLCTSAAGCTSLPIEDCCHDDDDCDDDNDCTADRCPADGAWCKHIWVPGCCASAADCDDGDPCTADVCTPDGCSWTAICCETDEDCDDGRDCTRDRCLEGTCASVADATSACCEPDVFSTGFEGPDGGGFTFEGGQGAVGWTIIPATGGTEGPALYYGDPVTHSYDTGGSNQGSALSPLFMVPGRAHVALQFRVRMNTETHFEKLHVDVLSPFGSARLYTNSTGNHVWEDVTIDLSGVEGLPIRFAFTFTADGSIFDEGVFIDDIAVVSECALAICTSVSVCDDGNACTIDRCRQNVCDYEWPVGCCTVDGDCDDRNPCTHDICDDNGCVHLPTGDPTCCVTDDDCAAADACSSGACVDNECVVEWDEDACPTAVPYVQTFDDAASFATVGWTTVAGDGTSGTNWVLRDEDGSMPSRYVRFDYMPSRSSYEHCLRSPNLTAEGGQEVTISFVQRFSAFVGTEADNQIGLWYSIDDWETRDPLWTWHERDGDIGLETLTRTLSLSPFADGLAVAFCASGEDSFQINYWDVDELLVRTGQAPTWQDVPAEIQAPASEQTELRLAASDPDGGPLNFRLAADAPAWAQIEPLPDDAEGLTALVTLTPGEEHEGSHVMRALVDDGAMPAEATIRITVSRAGESALFSETFDTGGFEELGWSTDSASPPDANDWQLLNGVPFDSRHARFSAFPQLQSFNETLTSPPIEAPRGHQLRLRWANELRALPGFESVPAVTAAIQVSVDGGSWQTVWSHSELDGDLGLGPLSVELSPDLFPRGNEASSFRFRFRLRGGDSTAIERWTVDDVTVLATPVEEN